MVSFIVCIYKEKLEWILRCIKSIINQTYGNIEIVVVIDNPQIDYIIIQELERLKQGNPFIIIHKNEKNIGAAKSRNIGVSISNGEFIAFLDSDDYSYNNRVEIELNYLLENNYDLVCSRYTAVDENGLILFESPQVNKSLNALLPLYNPIANPTVLMKKSVFVGLNGFRDLIVCEDYDLWLRVISNGFKCGLVNECLIYYTIRSNSLSHQNLLKTYYLNKIIKKYYKQRLKGNSDDFSVENVNLFLNSIKNYSKKEQRLEKAYSLLERAKKKKFMIPILLFRSFLCAPYYIFEWFFLKCRLLFIR